MSTIVATAALACVTGEAANAQTSPFVYGAGATSTSVTFRYLFDCMGYPVDGNPPAGGPTGYVPKLAFTPAVAAACPNTSQNYLQVLFAALTSGTAKKAFANFNPSLLGTPASSKAPIVSTYAPSWPYPALQFIGSEDPWLASDQASYVAAGGPGIGGNVIQIPTFAVALTIPFNGKDGNGNALNISNATPTGGSSGLNLSRQALCGIFSGNINQWNDPILTALNGGFALGTGPITVVYRTDNGAGTNYLLSQALFNQCLGVFGPASEGALTSYEFKFTDRTVPTSQCPSAIGVEPSDWTNWPAFGTDQCGNTLPTAPGQWKGASGINGLLTAVATTNGAIGYSTTDGTQPVASTGLANANLQGQYDIDNSTGSFWPPTTTAIAASVSAVNPFFPTDAARANPLNWSTQARFPNPSVPGGYPIVGFDWFDVYQCYKSSADFQNMVLILKYLLGYIGPSGQVPAIINSRGFDPVPSNWQNDVVTNLLQSSPIGIAGSGSCGGMTGAL